MTKKFVQERENIYFVYYTYINMCEHIYVLELSF